jgi:hypothetical protein
MEPVVDANSLADSVLFPQRSPLSGSTQGYLEKFDLRDRAETLLAAKERKSVHILKYSPVFVTQAAGNKIKQCRESNFSRCPQDPTAAVRRKVNWCIG